MFLIIKKKMYSNVLYKELTRDILKNNFFSDQAILR